MLESRFGANWLENPDQIFRNEELNDMLSTMFGFPMTQVPYNDFLSNLLADGNDSLIHTWTEIYDKEFLRKYLQEDQEMPVVAGWDTAGFRENFFSWGKIELLYPNLLEEIETPLEAVRRDIKYVVENATNIFQT